MCLLTCSFKNWKCPDTQQCLYHFYSLIKRCWAFENNSVWCWLSQKGRNANFFQAQHLFFVNVSKCLKFGLGWIIAEYHPIKAILSIQTIFDFQTDGLECVYNVYLFFRNCFSQLYSRYLKVNVKKFLFVV